MHKKGYTLLDVETCEIKTEYHVRRLKVGLQTVFPLLMANLVKILMYRKEMDLACYLTVFYQIAIDEEMVKNAIEMKQFSWLRYVYAFKKNKYADKNG